jgi:hypothetical protein
VELPQRAKFCLDCGAAKSDATDPLQESAFHSHTRPLLVILGIILVGVVFFIALIRERNGQSIHQLTQQAESGDATAQRKLGYAYLNGEGVPKDGAEAMRWFGKAADAGDAKAQSILGVGHTNEGMIVLPMTDERLSVLIKLAEAGDAWSAWRLGEIYGSGEGVSRDEAEAARWFRKGAEEGNVDAQEDIGMIYAYGVGIPEDDAEAYFWLNLASATWVGSSNGKARLKEERDIVGTKLPPEKRLEIQERCRKWVESHPQAHN